MASLAEHKSSHITKLMLIGDSGTGKTGALASLAKAGYSLHIIDFDNGLDILANTLRGDKEAMARVEFETFIDDMRNVGGKIQATTAKAWQGAIKTLTDWNPAKWGEKDILVVDSLTFAGRAALRFICGMNGRLGSAPYQSDFLDAQRLVENLLGMLFSNSIPCNVIVLSHIREVGRTTTIILADNKPIHV